MKNIFRSYAGKSIQKCGTVLYLVCNLDPGISDKLILIISNADPINNPAHQHRNGGKRDEST